MARTKAEVARLVLQDVLSAYHPSDSIPAEDDTQVDNAHENVLEELREAGIAYWDIDSTPNAVAHHVASIIGWEVAQAFGVPRSSLIVIDQHGRSASLREYAEQKLRRHIAKEPSGEPVEAEYE